VGNSETCYETPNTTSVKPKSSRNARAAWLKARRPPSKHAPAWLSPGPHLIQYFGDRLRSSQTPAAERLGIA
jgi:hypothetical protein